MPWTYSTLQQAITDWAENPETTFQSNIPNMVRMAELRIAETVQSPSVRQSVTGNMVIGVNTVTLPENFLAPYSLHATDQAGVRFYLANKEEEFCRLAYPDSAYKDRPEYYSIMGGVSSLFLVPTPDWVYPYRLSFFARPLSIVGAPTQTTYIGTNAEDVLFFACMKNSAVFMKEEKDVVDMYEAMYQQAVQNFLITGHGRDRKDWFRRPDKKVEV